MGGDELSTDAANQVPSQTAGAADNDYRTTYYSFKASNGSIALCSSSGVTKHLAVSHVSRRMRTNSLYLLGCESAGSAGNTQYHI